MTNVKAIIEKPSIKELKKNRNKPKLATIHSMNSLIPEDDDSSDDLGLHSHVHKYDSDDDSNIKKIGSNAANKSISRYSAGSSTFNNDLLNQKSKKLLNSTQQIEQDIFSNSSSGDGDTAAINPIMAIQQAYSKVNAVGSATAMVALKSGDR
jgi:hypothetical protein